ncbi:MAG: hypothetical protein ACRENE_27810 [Polyangiaceae bacterium]
MVSSTVLVWTASCSSESGAGGGNADSSGSSSGGRSSRDAGAVAASDTVEAGPPCDPQASTCSARLSCCSRVCVDTTLDPRNCGTCGNACGTANFCNGTTCNAAVIANLCDNQRATLVFDPITVDDDATLLVGNALVSACMFDAGVPQVAETDAGEGPAWRPSTGVGNTYVAMGGAFAQHGAAYFDDNALSTIYLLTDGTTASFNNRKTLAALVTTAVSDLSDHHDYFFLQVAVEPMTGTLEFMGVGILGPGTQAAGYYASAVVLPNYASYTDAWYVYDWTDANNDGTANAGDTFTLVAQGK